MHWYPSDTDRLDALISGAADIGQIKPELVQALRAGTENVVVQRFRTGVWRALSFNLQRETMGDSRVRAAISHLIDRQEIVDVVLCGMGEVANGPVPPTNWAYLDGRQLPHGDPVKAHELLTSAGFRGSQSEGWYRDGVRLKLKLTYLKHESFRTNTTLLIAKQLESAGIPVTTSPIGWDEYRRLDGRSFAEEDADAMVVGWSALTEPEEQLARLFMTGGSYNRFGYSNPNLDRLLAQMAASASRDETRDLYEQALELIENDAVMPALVYVDYVFGIRAGLTGFDNLVLDNFYEFTRHLVNFRWQ